MDLKLRGRLGEEQGDLKEIRLLNRIIRLDADGIRYEADPRHAELLGRALGFEQCKPKGTPSSKDPDDLEHGPQHNETDGHPKLVAIDPEVLEQRRACAVAYLNPEPREPQWHDKSRDMDGALIKIRNCVRCF